uniref:Uncharacterized protein n=1 Tax=Oncorhynchus kisutch TaxID=8019 RepID=A0A8C7M9J3_ONCKI
SGNRKVTSSNPRADKVQICRSAPEQAVNPLRLWYYKLRAENRALCDEVAHLEKFVRVKEEHRFLLKSILQYQSVSEGEMLIAASTSSHPPMTFSSSPTWASERTKGRRQGEWRRRRCVEPCLYQTTCRLDTFLCPVMMGSTRYSP